MSDAIVWLTIFVLAGFVGVEVISKVSSTLHTPLMSGANAIHGVILIGAILVAGSADSTAVLALALVLACLRHLGPVRDPVRGPVRLADQRLVPEHR